MWTKTPITDTMTKKDIHKWGLVIIFIHMEEIRKFIEERFTPTVQEDKNGMKVVFTAPMTEGTIWFERAKRGWSKKPLSTNTYIIVDAEMVHMLDFLNRYYNLTEDHYQDVRKLLIQMGMDVMDKHLNQGE